MIQNMQGTLKTTRSQKDQNFQVHYKLCLCITGAVLLGVVGEVAETCFLRFLATSTHRNDNCTSNLMTLMTSLPVKKVS